MTKSAWNADKFEPLRRGESGIERTKPVWRVKKTSMVKESFANVVKKGSSLQEEVPTIKVDTIGNGWLYRSAVATFAEHFQLNPVTTECSYGREVWLSCYGVPVHTWNVSTFCSIGKFWGGVVQVKEDTTKCARVDIGKIMIFTHHMSVINQKMRLMVGETLFDIRVAEEQAVFIHNSDSRWVVDDIPLGDGSDDTRSFIAVNQVDTNAHREGNGDGFLKEMGGEESRGHTLSLNALDANPIDNEIFVNMEKEVLGASESGNTQVFFRERGPGPLKPINSTSGPVIRSSLVAMENIQDVEPHSIRPMSYHFGPVLNFEGINLEVVFGDSLVNTKYELPRPSLVDSLTVQTS
ncbi:hypothetical protein Dimus_036050 [Dionaea muscipula]